MKIIPAIDLKEGKCVRLFKGDFDRTTEYSSNPAEIGRQFSALDVTDLHIVDLDGARSGRQSNHEIVAEISAESGLAIQLGGGIRTRADVERWLSKGVERCVVGSVAINEPAEVKKWISEFGGEQIVLALDVKIDAAGVPLLTTFGWTRNTGITFWDCVEQYLSADVQHVLCTDVSRDGAMSGPNHELYVEVMQRYPSLQLQASGGVRDVADLQKLCAAGVPVAITGRALLDGKIGATEVASFRQSA